MNRDQERATVDGYCIQVLIVNGEVRDLSREIDTDATIEIVTKGHDEVLPLIRHDCAHVMAEAVQELYPDTQVTIGPSIENGFYYDFARATPFTPDDLVKIEKQMHKIIERNEPIVREVWDRNEAIKFFLDKGESTKPRSSVIFPKPRRSPAIARVTSLICAVVRTHRRPAKSARPSN